MVFGYGAAGECMEKELPVRKHPRLKGYNYSGKGAYFITFCVKDGHEVLGQIVGRGILDAPCTIDDAPCTPDAPCTVELSEYGINLRNTIDFVNKNSGNIVIDKYVIMPNHVHMIVLIDSAGGAACGDGGVECRGGAACGDGGAECRGGGASSTVHGASGKPRPTNALIPKLLSSIKRYTNKLAGFNVWQDSYHDHIIRTEADYERIAQYIDENPARWEEDCYYTK